MAALARGGAPRVTMAQVPVSLAGISRFWCALALARSSVVRRARACGAGGLAQPSVLRRPWSWACGGLGLALIAAGAACQGDRRARPTDRSDGDRPIEMLVASDPESLDPRYATDAVGLRTTRLVHAGLVRLDPGTLAPRPYVASRWRWLDPLTLRVELRRDVVFHSGAPLRPQDVVETLRAIASPRVASRLARIVEAIGRVDVDGDDAVVIHLARPHATLLTDLELPILRADQAASPPSRDGSLDGLGPYAVASVTRGEVRLVPASGGALARPARAVTLRTVHDENARVLRLEVGRSDVSLNLISPALLPALAGEPGLAVAARPGANLTYIVVNELRGPLGDARVRRALSKAIDRRTITRALFGARAQPAAGLIPPSSWAHSDLAPLELDPEAARSLLIEAGAARARVTLLSSTERLRLDVARTIAQELSDVGLEATVVPLELGTMIARLGAGDFDLAIVNLPEMTEPNILRYFLHSAFVPPAGTNRGHVRDAELDALLDEGDGAPEETVRRAIYARVEAREREQMHLVPLWYEDQVAVTSERARAFVPSAEGRWLSLASLK